MKKNRKHDSGAEQSEDHAPAQFRLCGTMHRAKRGASTGLSRASVLPLESGKGQISAEFVITLVLLFLMFSLVVAVSAEQKENINFEAEKIKAKTLSEKTSRAINGIYISGNGSKTTITKEFDFEIEFEENSVKVKFRQGQFVSSPLLTKKINFIQKTNANEIRIENLNGVIEIEEL